MNHFVDMMSEASGSKSPIKKINKVTLIEAVDYIKKKVSDPNFKVT